MATPASRASWKQSRIVIATLRRLKVLVSIRALLISIIGPKTRQARIAPGVKVFTNDSAMNESTVGAPAQGQDRALGVVLTHGLAALRQPDAERLVRRAEQDGRSVLFRAKAWNPAERGDRRAGIRARHHRLPITSPQAQLAPGGRGEDRPAAPVARRPAQVLNPPRPAVEAQTLDAALRLPPAHAAILTGATQHRPVGPPDQGGSAKAVADQPLAQRTRCCIKQRDWPADLSGSQRHPVGRPGQRNDVVVQHGLPAGCERRWRWWLFGHWGAPQGQESGVRSQSQDQLLV